MTADLVAACNKKILNGETQDKIVQYLHESGFSILDSMKMIRELYHVSLGDAKNIVASVDCWSLVQMEADELHKKIIENIDN